MGLLCIVQMSAVFEYIRKFRIWMARTRFVCMLVYWTLAFDCANNNNSNKMRYAYWEEINNKTVDGSQLANEKSTVFQLCSQMWNYLFTEMFWRAW